MSELGTYIQSYFGIRQEDLAQIAALFQSSALKKDDFFLRSGRNCDKLSFVDAGILRIYAETPEKEVTQWISTKGYFVTDLSSFIFDTPARWNIQCLTDVRLFTIDKAAYRKLGKVVPQWHELEKLFIARCFVILENRVFGHLSLSAEERYDQLFAQSPELFNQVPLHYIASMLGMTPETFSRVRKKKLG